MNTRIILVSHFGLASGIKKALEFIVGVQKEVYTIELDEEGIEAFKEKCRLLSKDSFEGTTIIVSDLPAGSPGATAFSLLNGTGDVRLISGMNLPLLLDLVLSSSVKTIDALIPEAISSAKEAIQDYTIVTNEEVDDEF
ncbi:PTS sugar transporter subunit IIA [Enterococcus termitis]|uniref:PTS sugar transporter subunit IIA n=1 Tax=Enterococcus termitis TaxID=332950 RepID=UPI000922905B|nr:hypothetical protein [Enterococcus termitis]OJG98920.1 hypothetical protein RV18_GL002782 [Enterococcus termitis]